MTRSDAQRRRGARVAGRPGGKMMFTVAMVLLSFVAKTVLGDVTLDEELMLMTRNSIRLAMETFHEDVEANVADVGFESITSYTDEPDKAVLAVKDGYCYLVFRATTSWNNEDIYQNFEPGFSDVCSDGECCEARDGYWEAFFDVNYFDQLMADLDSCVLAETSHCIETNSMDCVIVAGHSAAGAIANVAAIYLHYYNPLMIAFGSTTALKAPCALIQYDRWYMYINTLVDDSDGLEYDLITQHGWPDTGFFGHTFVITEDDNSGVAYLGMTDEQYSVDIGSESGSFDAHDHDWYSANIQALIDYGEFPVRTTGFPLDHACNFDEECGEGYCIENNVLGYKTCMNKFGSCEACNEHSDCLSGNCLWTFQCTNPETNRVEDGCDCLSDDQCESGWCDYGEGSCQPKLPSGSTCFDDDACQSGNCSWFTCD